MMRKPIKLLGTLLLLVAECVQHASNTQNGRSTMILWFMLPIKPVSSKKNA